MQKIMNSRWTWIAVLTLAVVGAYSNIFGNEFLYDDEFLIQKNRFLREWSFLFEILTTSSTAGSGGVDSFYRPVQGLINLVIFQCFGLSELGFHLPNLLLHVANSALLLVLATRLGFSKTASYCAALLWALQPIHTEAVTYMSATADPSYAFFCLLGVTLLVPTFAWTRVALASVCMLLGLLSKESAIVFPGLVLATLLLIANGRRTQWRTYLPLLPFVVIALFYLLARKTILNFNESFDFYKVSNIYTENMLYRFYTFLATLPEYLRLLVWPDSLSIDKPFPVYVEYLFRPVIVGSLILSLTLAFLIWDRFRKFPSISWGLLWFGAAHFPHTGVFLPVNSFFLDHWMYLPSMGLFLGVAEGISNAAQGPQLRKLLAVGVGIVSICFAILTYRQNQVWETPLTLYTRILEINPSAARVHNNLAMAYAERKMDDLAIEHYLKAIQISDQYPQTHHNLALAYVRKEKFQEAIEHLKKAVTMNPRFHPSWQTLGEIYSFSGESAKSKEALETAKKLRDELGIR